MACCRLRCPTPVSNLRLPLPSPATLPVAASRFRQVLLRVMIVQVITLVLLALLQLTYGR